MVSSLFPYDTKYFERYLQKGRYTKRLVGDNRSLHEFWTSFLRRNVRRSARVLEVGCGLGFFGRRLQKEFTYVGFDISIDALTYARVLNHLSTSVSGEAGALPFRDHSFDALVAFDLVEHLMDPLLFFGEAWRVLKPDGIVVVTTPNISSLGNRVKSGSRSLRPAMHTDASHVSLFPREVWSQKITQTHLVIEAMGTDTLWDLPYSDRLPVALQKAILVPFNLIVSRFFGFLRWTLGENLVIIARR